MLFKSWHSGIFLLTLLKMFEMRLISEIYNQLGSLDYDEENDESLTSRGESSVEEDFNWPKQDILKNVTQVSAVDFDKFGNLHVFHRGNRVWDMGSFDRNDNYLQRDLGPINVDAILILDPSNGEIIKSWGKNRFYLPHGITLDSNGNTWITDVALHQVMKFNHKDKEPALVLGKKFEPGSDINHFCKPTDVAILSSGHFFVSDGYCNSRIMEFKPDGTFDKEIGLTENMNVPHGLSLIEEKKTLCVADRENARILCYSLASEKDKEYGQVIAEYKIHLGAVYAIDHKDNLMYAVTGPRSLGAEPWGLTMNLNNGIILDIWNSPKGFSMPHDIAVSPDKKCLFIADAGAKAPKKLYKFHIIM